MSANHHSNSPSSIGILPKLEIPLDGRDIKTSYVMNKLQSTLASTSPSLATIGESLHSTSDELPVQQPTLKAWPDWPDLILHPIESKTLAKSKINIKDLAVLYNISGVGLGNFATNPSGFFQPILRSQIDADGLYDQCLMCENCLDSDEQVANHEPLRFQCDENEHSKAKAVSCRCRDVPGELMKYFVDGGAAVGGLDEMQREALDRWKFWKPLMKASRRENALPLSQLLKIFDHYFSRGALHEKLMVKWPEFVSDFENLALMEEDPEDSERFLISIYKPRQWDLSSIRLILGTLLHELAHAAMDVLGCCCQKCLCFLNQLGAHGVSGHGSPWMKLARAMELEANRVFPLKTGFGCAG